MGNKKKCSSDKEKADKGKYTCKKCGRKADKEKHLCKPEKKTPS